MESVTVTPQSYHDGNGDPVAGGEPLVLNAFAVAPGNTTAEFTNSGGVDSAEFTVYLPVDAPVNNDDLIEVRGRKCYARVQKWVDPWPGAEPLDGVVVLCKSRTGTSS